MFRNEAGTRRTTQDDNLANQYVFLCAQIFCLFVCLLSKVEELFKLWSPLYETYVALVEDLINDGFTRHQRDEDLSYGKNIIEAINL